jgi:hypothetical protein
MVSCALALGLVIAAPAGALPANPWSGRWLIPASTTNGSGDQVVTLTQTGNTIAGAFSWCGGGTWSGTISPDQTTWTGEFRGPPGLPGCSGTGHGTFTETMAPDGRSFSGTGSTDYGNGFTFSATYVSGGTEPRLAARTPCAGGPWSGLWTARGSNVFSFSQNGTALSGVVVDQPETETGTISGNTARGTYRIPEGTGTFTLTLAPDANSFDTQGTTTTGAPAQPFTARFLRCETGLPGVNLQTTIPDPQTLRAGPTSLVAPARVSLTSLRRSKCVLVKVGSTRPARILVSIFSGRRSIRLFGQKRVVFFAPGRRQVCIPVPFRARTFNVRTPLNVALGYAAGARPQRGERKPSPGIRNITLVP